MSPSDGFMGPSMALEKEDHGETGLLWETKKCDLQHLTKKKS
jgi:hypothetical protein